MIESGKFDAKRGWSFLHLRRSSGDWGNLRGAILKRHHIQDMFGHGILSMTGLSREVVAVS
jgi:hypothetical protein